MKCFLNLVLFCLLFSTLTVAQNTKNHTDSDKVIMLSDVKVSGRIDRLLLTSGKKDNRSHIMGPGGGFAFRFVAPLSELHSLTQIRLHLSKPAKIEEGQLSIRIASITPNDRPADDNLLPAPLIIKTETLQRTKQSLTLSWPTNAVIVPSNGFFIVVECLGRTADEFVSAAASSKKIGPYYEIKSDRTATASVRQVSIKHLPSVAIATPTLGTTTWYYKDTVTQEWRNQNKDYVIFLEAEFK